MKKVITFLIFSMAWCSLTGQNSFSITEYKSFLQDVENLSFSGLSSLQPISEEYYSGIDNNGSLKSDYQFMDSITDKYGLTDPELELLEENHFVVTERLSFPSMGQAFADIFHKDLPVFVSTDAILHAMHKSYDEILQDIERQFLEPNLVEISDELYNSYNELKSIYPNADDTLLVQALKDVDLYVTITQSLIKDSLVSSNYTDQSSVSEVWDAIMAEENTEMPLFTWNNRQLDFSQFKPRGHYKYDEELSMYIGTSLEPYFRSMMWLGRMDFLLSDMPKHEELDSLDIRRMTLGAFMLNELLDLSGARALLETNNELIDFFVGKSDNLTADEFTNVVDSMDIHSATRLLDDSVYQALNKELTTVPEYGQEILSGILMMDPYSPEPDALPVSFRLMGQRFVIDSYIFSNVVFDRIIYQNEKVWRPMPDPLDALFVLGNNDALPLLQSELESYHYASQLASLRYLVDSYKDAYWNKTLYNTWLGAIRSLNPEYDTSGYPSFMQTDAWRLEKLNTQLASWAQLRHDNLLYTKQSYTGGTICSYPHSFVEPYPEFYEQAEQFATNARDIISGVEFSRQEAIMNYFMSFAEKVDTLANIARKELNEEPFNQDEISFLKTMLIKQPELVCAATPYTGWFFDLFYHGYDSGIEEDFLVADVHTQPTDQYGSMGGKVLHVGVGKVNLGLFLAKSPSAGYKPMVYVGPVMSYYEKITSDYHRMTDQEWADSVRNGNLPNRPGWTSIYLADNDGGANTVVSTLPENGRLKVYTGTRNAGLTDTFKPLVYPSPARGDVHVEFYLPHASPVNITLYNSQGKLMKTLLNHFSAGKHEKVINIDGFKGDFCLMEIQAGNLKATRKILLSR